MLTTGDGGSGYDPFNLGQNNMEIAGKIIEIDVDKNVFVDNPPIATRFDELPEAIQETLTLITKGVRNITGITYQSYNNQYIKYVGNVGQDLVESIFSFKEYKPVPIREIVNAGSMNRDPLPEGFINFGWRGWEGAFPTPILRDCSANTTLNEKITAYYDEAVSLSVLRLPPLTCYYHQDPRQDKIEGEALTAVKVYLGADIPELTGGIVFTDFGKAGAQAVARGTLAYTRLRPDCIMSDYSIIDIDHDFGAQSSYFTTLGVNLDQTRLYLGVYASRNVTDFNLGTVYEIIP